MYKHHGYSQSRVYDIWFMMKKRCLNSRDKDYKNYGARGITICDEWLEPKSFCDWALANGYKENLQIDRIDSHYHRIYQTKNYQRAIY